MSAADGDYRAQRNRLVVHEFARAAWIAFGLTLLYSTSDLTLDPSGFRSDWARNVVLLAVPLVGLWLVRGPLHRYALAVVLGVDFFYTITLAMALLVPANTVSGTALFVSLKMVGTALLLRWPPLVQLGATLATLALYFAMLQIAGHWQNHLPLHQTLGPLIGGFFSVFGAYRIDRYNRYVFEQTVELEAANRIQRQFVDNMSHELRTPLQVISGYTDLLIRDDAVQREPRLRAFAERVRGSTRALSRLVENVLEYARIARRQTPIHVVDFPLDRLLLDLRLLGNEIRGDAEIDLRIDDVPGVHIHTDYERLYSVLSNLLINAIKFTAQGHVHLGVQSHGNMLEFHIRDSGMGIPEERIASVTEPFEQIDGSMTRRFPGVGLGLSVVRHNVELLGGTLHMDSVVGKGTMVRVKIPLGRV